MKADLANPALASNDTQGQGRSSTCNPILPSYSGNISVRYGSGHENGARTSPQQDQAKSNAPPITVAELINRHYLPYAQAQKKSWKIDETCFRLHVIPVIGDMVAAEVRETDIIRVLTDLRAKGLGQGSEYRLITCIKHLWNLAIRWEIPGIARNPAGKLKTKEIDGRERYLTPEEMKRLLGVLSREKASRAVSIVRLLLLTGARRNEINLARWSQVHWATNSLRVPSKGGRERSIHLNSEALKIIEALPSRGVSEYLFPGKKCAQPTSFFKTWIRIRRKAGLSDLRLHDLRHNFASLLVNSGHSLYLVQTLLGHRTLRMSQRYAHLANQTVTDAAEVVGRLIADAELTKQK